MFLQSLPQYFALKTQEIKHSGSDLETACETGPACSHPEGPSEWSQQKERHSHPNGILLSLALTMPKAEPVFKSKFVLNFLLLEFEKIMMDTDGTYLITTGGRSFGCRMVWIVLSALSLHQSSIRIELSLFPELCEPTAQTCNHSVGFDFLSINSVSHPIQEHLNFKRWLTYPKGMHSFSNICQVIEISSLAPLLTVYH